MKPFTRQAYIEPTGIEKILKKNPEKNYLVDINNLFADNELSEVSAAQIQAFAEIYKLKNAYQKFGVELVQMLKTFLNEHLGNPQSSINDSVAAKKVQSLLGIPEADFAKEYKARALEAFKRQVYETLSRTKKRHEEESAHFEKLQKQLELSDEDATKVIGEVAQTIVQDFTTAMISDCRISPDEAEAWERLCKDLEVSASLDDGSKQVIEKYKTLWKLENEPLLIYKTDIFLQKGEFCHYQAGASLYEDRKQTTGVSYSGPTYRFRIAKGFYYRAGNLSTTRKTEDVSSWIDSGVLYVTNKRLLFNGNKGNKAIRYSQIVDLEPFIDGVKIIKDSGKPPTFWLSTNDGEILTAIIARLIRESQA